MSETSKNFVFVQDNNIYHNHNMLDKMSDASRIVDRQKAKGLIQRTQSPHDRRSVEVRITKEGLRFLDVTDPEVEKFDLLFSNLEGEEVETLNLLLDKIRT